MKIQNNTLFYYVYARIRLSAARDHIIPEDKNSFIKKKKNHYIYYSMNSDIPLQLHSNYETFSTIDKYIEIYYMFRDLASLDHQSIKRWLKQKKTRETRLFAFSVRIFVLATLNDIIILIKIEIDKIKEKRYNVIIYGDY